MEIKTTLTSEELETLLKLELPEKLRNKLKLLNKELIDAQVIHCNPIDIALLKVEFQDKYNKKYRRVNYGL